MAGGQGKKEGVSLSVRGRVRDAGAGAGAGAGWAASGCTSDKGSAVGNSTTSGAVMPVGSRLQGSKHSRVTSSAYGRGGGSLLHRHHWRWCDDG